MTSWHYNPERRTWRGKSYRKGGENIRSLKEKQDMTYVEKLDKWYQTEKAAGRVLDIKFFPPEPEDLAGRTLEEWKETCARAMYETLTGIRESIPLTEEELAEL